MSIPFASKIKGTLSGVKDELTQGAENAVKEGWSDKLGAAADLPGKLTGVADKISGGSAHALVPLAVSVLVGGKELDAKTVFIEGIQTRMAVNEIPSATVTISLPQSAPEDYAPLDALLNQCKVGGVAQLKLDKLTVFDGVVGALRVTRSEGVCRISLRFKHLLQGLKATSRSRVWKAQQDAALVQQVLKEHNIKVGTVTLAEGKPVQRVQWKCSDWHFLRALTGEHGAWFWVQMDGTVKVQPPAMGGKTHQVSAKNSAAGIMVLNAEWGFSCLQQPKGVGTQSWNMDEQAPHKNTAKKITLGSGALAPDAIKALGLESDMLLTGQRDSTIQQGTADGLLLTQHAQAVRVRLTLAGCQPFQPGDTVSLDGFGTHLNGQGLVTQVEFQCDKNSRMGQTIVGVGLDDEAALFPEMPVPEGQVNGIVADFAVDPESGRNRIAVKVPLLGTESLWARMGHLYATKEAGVTFYPEVGDEVGLAWIGSDPLIDSRLHNPKRKAPFEPSKDNLRKGILLRHEAKRAEWRVDVKTPTMTVELGNDKDPEQHLTVHEEQGTKLISKKGDFTVELKEGLVDFKAKKHFSLDVEDKVIVKAKQNVTVNTDENMALEAKKNQVIKGDVKVEVASTETKLDMDKEAAKLTALNVTLTGTKTAVVKSDKDTTLEGLNTTVKGTTKVEVSSTAGEVDVKGGKLKLSGTEEASLSSPAKATVSASDCEIGGSGITAIKGSTIKLG